MIITNVPYLLIFGQDIVYWTGMIGGCAFMVVIVSALIKQYNASIWIKYQIPMTKLHHIFGWSSVALLIIHTILAILQFNFHIFF